MKRKTPLLVSYFPLLQAVSRVRNQKCKRLLLKQLARDEGFANCLREVSMNVLDQSIPMDKPVKRKLNKHAAIVRALSKRKKIEQSGGFLNIAVPLLSMVVAGLLNNAKN